MAAIAAPSIHNVHKHRMHKATGTAVVTDSNQALKAPAGGAETLSAIDHRCGGMHISAT